MADEREASTDKADVFGSVSGMGEGRERESEGEGEVASEVEGEVCGGDGICCDRYMQGIDAMKENCCCSCAVVLSEGGKGDVVVCV